MIRETKTTAKRQIFLSYRRKDNENDGFIDKLHGIIEKLTGFSVFIDQQDLPEGDPEGYKKNLKDAINDCVCFIPVVTKEYVNFRETNDFCKYELVCALKKAKMDSLRIIPIVVDDAFVSDIDLTATKDLSDFNSEELENATDTELIAILQKINVRISKTASISKEDIDNEDVQQRLISSIFDSFFVENGEYIVFSDFLNTQLESLNCSPLEDSKILSIEDFYQLNIKKQKTCTEIEIERSKIRKKIDEIKKERKAKKKEKEREPKELAISIDPYYPYSCITEFIEQLYDDKRMVILGDAGSGKTVYLKQLCKILSKYSIRFNGPKSRLFPIFVKLKDLCDYRSSGDIFEAIANATNKYMNKSMILALIKHGNPCFLFDGIDEVNPSVFNVIFGDLNNNLNNKNIHMVFTSRPGQKMIRNNDDIEMAYDGGTTLLRRWLLGEIPNDIFEEVVKKIYSNVNNDDSKIDSFINALKEKERENQNYTNISRNPFLLSLMSTNYEANQQLPGTILEVLEKAINGIIDREIDKNPQKNDGILRGDIKQILGVFSYNLYKAKDGEYQKTNIKDIIEEQFEGKKQAQLESFFKNHVLIDDNGFSHDLFACYYCAFYFYKLICKPDTDLPMFDSLIQNSDKEYWKGVVEMVLCLIEKNAKGEKQDSHIKILAQWLERMQPVNGNPDYDLLCKSVAQFIDKNNRTIGEVLLILGMLKRGEQGVKNFNTKIKNYAECVNPYEELFYYVVKYNIKNGANKVNSIRQQKDDDCKLFEKKVNFPPIQSFLFSELCETINIPVKKCCAPITYKKALSALSSPNRRFTNIERKLRGHIRMKTTASTLKSEYFEDCDELTSVKLSPRLKYIGEFAFSGCRRLNFLYIPKSVIGIGWRALSGCSNLNIEVSPKNREYLSIGNCLIRRVSKTLVWGNAKSIIPPDGIVKCIGNSAFVWCDSMTKLIIPQGVTTIKSGAIDGCNELTSIELSSTIRELEPNAIENCNNLSIISCPNDIVEMIPSAIKDCERYEAYSPDGINTIIKIQKKSENKDKDASGMDKSFTITEIYKFTDIEEYGEDADDEDDEDDEDDDSLREKISEWIEDQACEYGDKFDSILLEKYVDYEKVEKYKNKYQKKSTKLLNRKSIFSNIHGRFNEFLTDRIEGTFEDLFATLFGILSIFIIFIIGISMLIVGIKAWPSDLSFIEACAMSIKQVYNAGLLGISIHLVFGIGFIMGCFGLLIWYMLFNPLCFTGRSFYKAIYKSSIKLEAKKIALDELIEKRAIADNSNKCK